MLKTIHNPWLSISIPCIQYNTSHFHPPLNITTHIYTSSPASIPYQNMKPTTISLLSLISLTTAFPTPPWINWQNHCMSLGTGTQIASQFTSLLTSYNPTTAQSLLSPTDFTDTSDSINFLANIPLNSTTFNSSQVFMGSQALQPSISLDILAVDSVSCEGVITFRWVATNVDMEADADAGTDKVAVKGIDVLYASLEEGGDVGSIGEGGWRLNRVFSEFNSAGWAADVGGDCVMTQRQGQQGQQQRRRRGGVRV